MTNRMETMRVMTFNIRYDNPEDLANSWKYRRDMVSSMIRFHNVHVAGLQEVLDNQIKDLGERLCDYAWIGVGRDDGNKKGEYAPIFYKKSAVELIDWGVFWLSETPNISGSIGWDAACVRITTWAKFRHISSNNSFFCFNTHFDHVGHNAMRESSYLLLKKIENIAGELSVIVTGDFNNTNESEVYKILTGEVTVGSTRHNSKLRDTYFESSYEHHGPTMTFHDFKAQEIFRTICKDGYKNEIHYDDEIDKPIDFIFVKNHIEVLQHGTLSDTWNGKYPSDHMPVVAEMYI